MRKSERAARGPNEHDAAPLPAEFTPPLVARPQPRRSVLVLRELIAAPFEGGAQALLLPDLRELDADVRSCRIERRDHVESGMHGIGEAHGVGAAVYGQLGIGERFR